ncbi:MAG: YchJ family protein [Thalassospira sp.]|uniref:YchJ family protein n=1 Tax=Thalassospira sp. TaxID=1912094 RepID=UPI0032EF7564
MPVLQATAPCPCASNQTYGECCGKYHTDKAKAETAEKLMRSRYSAFVVRDGAYLLATLAKEKHDSFDAESIKHDQTRWSGLEIVECVAGGLLDQSGKVEFIARFIEDGQQGQLHESSNFERRGGKWYYVDGVFPDGTAKTVEKTDKRNEPSSDKVTKTGRNDPCPCGSGKKFKKCCG